MNSVIIYEGFRIRLNFQKPLQSLFRIYFLGDYTPDGKLIDPQDPMLYWIIPVTMKPGKHPLNDPRPEHFDDYLTEHSGFIFDWRNLRP